MDAKRKLEDSAKKQKIDINKCNSEKKNEIAIAKKEARLALEKAMKKEIENYERKVIKGTGKFLESQVAETKKFRVENSELKVLLDAKNTFS